MSPTDSPWTLEELAAMSVDELTKLREEYGGGVSGGVYWVPTADSRKRRSRPRTWSERPSPIQPDGSLILGQPAPDPWMTADESARLKLSPEDEAWVESMVDKDLDG